MSSNDAYVQFENPTYNDADDSGFGKAANQNEFAMIDQYISEVGKGIRELREEEENANLVLANLNFCKIGTDNVMEKWRKGPAPPDDQDKATTSRKLAHLEGPFELKTNQPDISFEFLLDIDLSDEEKNRTASNALINYFSHLGTTYSNTKADIIFLDTLLTSADINSIDIHGQSIMHEVAREWNTDLAYYLKLKGANIDIADNWGRTPLFVACASNHKRMVQWLLKNGADLHHRTLKGEGQSVIHYAAKYDAIDTFKELLKWDANPIERDDRLRTPLFLAAELGLAKMCTFMLKLDLPVASYNNSGVSAIDHIINKLPVQLAKQALDQFITVERTTKRKRYFVNCLGKRRWRLLSNFQYCNGMYEPPGPLEIIVARNDLQLINHPIILELISLKREQFGFKFNIINILFYLLFTIVWTISISIRKKHDLFEDTNMKVVLFLTAIGQFFTFLFIYKLIAEYRTYAKGLNEDRKRLLSDIDKERPFCHPCWVMEADLLSKNEELATRLTQKFWNDPWNIIEALCLVMATIETIITILWASYNNNTLRDLQNYYSAVFILFVWLRLNRSLRLVQSLGPFIAMLGECVNATAKFAFLFFEFFIPFSAAFWVTFGGVRKGSEGGEYEMFHDLLYQLYLLTIVGDYEYNTLKKIDKLSSQILVGFYLVLVSVVSLNLFIALLSEAVSRVNETASATAFLKEAEELLNLERNFPEVKRNFEVYVNKYCAPKVVLTGGRSRQQVRNLREIVNDISKSLLEIKEELQGITSDYTKIKRNLNKVDDVMSNFKEKYNENKIEGIWKSFMDVFDFHLTPLNKIHRKTRNQVLEFIRSRFNAEADTNLQ